MKNDPSELVLTDLRYAACNMLIKIFKSIQKCQIWSIKPINQHYFRSVNTSI